MLSHPLGVYFFQELLELLDGLGIKIRTMIIAKHLEYFWVFTPLAPLAVQLEEPECLPTLRYKPMRILCAKAFGDVHLQNKSIAVVLRQNVAHLSDLVGSAGSLHRQEAADIFVAYFLNHPVRMNSTDQFGNTE